MLKRSDDARWRQDGNAPPPSRAVGVEWAASTSHPVRQQPSWPRPAGASVLAAGAGVRPAQGVRPGAGPGACGDTAACQGCAARPAHRGMRPQGGNAEFSVRCRCSPPHPRWTPWWLRRSPCSGTKPQRGQRWDPWSCGPLQQGVGLPPLGTAHRALRAAAPGAFCSPALPNFGWAASRLRGCRGAAYEGLRCAPCHQRKAPRPAWPVLGLAPSGVRRCCCCVEGLERLWNSAESRTV